MKNEKPSIVFFGSGPVAAESLRLLAEDLFIEAVVTKPTTEAEMAHVIGSTPVFTVSDKRALDDFFATKSFDSSVGILIDFGIIVSKKIIDAFPKGIVNSHFSLLPELRGADPISFAILEGKQKTGVSLMLLVEAMDEGPLLAQSEIEIDPEDTTITLTEKLISLSDGMMKNILPLWVNGKISEAPQESVTIADSSTPTYTRKLTKSDGVIDWSKSAVQIEREIRAYSGWPKSRTTIGSIEVVITKAHAKPSDLGKSGEILKDLIHEKVLAVQTGDGHLYIDKIKPAGKKEMDAAGFINGYGNRIIDLL